MTRIKVVTDSGADLPEEIAASLGIEVVPLTVRFGDEEFVDRIELSTEEFWKRCAANTQLPQTAAPSPGAFEAAFLKAADDGYDGVVCCNISSGVSATMQSAQLAASAVASRIPVRLVDTLLVSGAEALVVMAAAESAKTGNGIDEVVSAATAAQAKVEIFGALDTMENLVKGGRVGKARALLGSLLNIKPVIRFEDGEVAQDSKQRTRRRSMEYLAAKLNAQPVARAIAIHGHACDIDAFTAMLSDGYTGSLDTWELGPTIGTHGGPGLIGIAFLKD